MTYTQAMQFLKAFSFDDEGRGETIVAAIEAEHERMAVIIMRLRNLTYEDFRDEDAYAAETERLIRGEG
jgi:hypothetical protein